MAAQSTPLSVANVSGPDIDNLFSLQGSIAPNDEFTDIALPGISGKAILHSRTFRGAAGSKAEGRTAYQYRIDLTNATTLAEVSCVTSLSVKFGAIAKLRYGGRPLRDVYQIVEGVPPNQIGLATAVQTENVVTFTFAQPICAADADNPGKTSFFFGLSSFDAPVRGVRVQIGAPAVGDIPVKSFGPIR